MILKESELCKECEYYLYVDEKEEFCYLQLEKIDVCNFVPYDGKQIKQDMTFDF